MINSDDLNIGDYIKVDYLRKGLGLQRRGYVYSTGRRKIRLSDQPPEEVLWIHTQKIKRSDIVSYEILKKDSNLEERATETDPVEWI